MVDKCGLVMDDGKPFHILNCLEILWDFTLSREELMNEWRCMKVYRENYDEFI